MASRLTLGALYAMLCLIWGSTWLAILIGLRGAPPFLSAALQFLVASLVLLPLVAAFKSRMPRGRTEWALVVVVGLVLFTLDYGLIYWGENNGVESGLSAILFATFVFQTAAFAHLLLPDERFTWQKLAGGVLAFAGILLIFREEVGSAGFEKFFPMLAIVLAATCAAFSSVATKRWGHDVAPVPYTATSMAVGTAGLFALSLATGEPWTIRSWPEAIGAIVYLAVAGSVVTFVTWWWLLKRLGATSMSYVAFVTPIVAVVLGFTIGSEVLDPLALVGAAVTLVGIYLSVSRRLAGWTRGLVGGVPEAALPLDPPKK